MSAKQTVQNLLDHADIQIGGDRPWDIQVHEEGLYDRVLSQGPMGLGESYMDGWWDVSKLDEFFAKVLRAGLEKKVRMNPATVWNFVKARIINMPALRAFEVGEEHYDVGNDLYEAMLDDRLTYTCGYWKYTETLDGAQDDKLDLVCKKIGLEGGERVLDIGSGWGSFIGFAAEKYGADCVGLTVSKEQAKYANERYAGVSAETRLQDYRDINEKFDRVVSLGMFEHVGYKNYRAYMKKVHEVLADDGLFLLHTIGSSESVFSADPWFNKYIFPNSMLPSVRQIAKAYEGLFVMEDWHNLGHYYDTTLMHWFKNFDEAWPELEDKYGERFYRMWKYYLLSMAGAFRARKNQLWQVVFSKKGVKGGYQSVR